MAPGLSQFIEGESPSLIDLKKRMEAKNLKVAMNAGIDDTRLFGSSRSCLGKSG
jgi:hypothetical protein